MILPTSLLLLATAPLPLQTHEDIERWVGELSSGDYDVRESARREVSTLRPSVLIPYRQALFDAFRDTEDGDVFWSLSYCLASLLDSETAWLLESAALLDEDDRRRLLESWTLEIHKPLAPPLDPAAQTALGSALRSGSSPKQMMAAELIRAAGERFQEDLGALIAGLNDPDPALRALCAETLGDRRGGGEALAERELTGALDDPDRSVAEAAALALAKRSGPLSRRLESILIEIGRSGEASLAAINVLGREGLSEEARARLLDLCRQGSFQSRAVAIESLWTAHGRPESLSFDLGEAMTELCLSTDEEAQKVAREVTATLGRAALPALRTGLTSPDMSVRYSSAVCLRSCGASLDESARALTAFLPFFNSGFQALEDLGPEVLPHLRPYLHRLDETVPYNRCSDWQPVRSTVISAISRFSNDSRAHALVEDILESSLSDSAKEDALSVLSYTELLPRSLVLRLVALMDRGWGHPWIVLEALNGHEHLAPDRIARSLERFIARRLEVAGAYETSALSILQACGRAESAPFAKRLVFQRELPTKLRARALECWLVLEPDPSCVDVGRLISTLGIRDLNEENHAIWTEHLLRGLTLRTDIELDPELARSLVKQDPFSAASLGFLSSRPRLGQELLLELLKAAPLSEPLEAEDIDGWCLAEAIDTIRPPVGVYLPVLLDRLWIDGDVAERQPERLPDPAILSCFGSFRGEIDRLPEELRERCRREALSLLDLIDHYPTLWDVGFEEGEPWGWGDAEVSVAAILGGDAVRARILDLLEEDASLVSVLLEAGMPSGVVANRVLAVLRDGVRMPDDDDLMNALIPLGSAARDAVPLICELMANDDIDLVTGLDLLGTLLAGTGAELAIFERIRSASPSDVSPGTVLCVKFAEDRIVGRPIRVPPEIHCLEPRERSWILDELDRLRARQQESHTAKESVR